MQRTAARRWLVALLLISALLSGVPVWWGLPSDEAWAFDEINPVQTATAQAWPVRYPPGHRYLLLAAYAPLELLGLEADDLHHARYLAGRLLTAVLATLAVFLLYRVGRLVGLQRRAALLAAAILPFGPTFTYYAKTVNLDIPYVFWFLVALFFFARAMRKRRARDFVFFAAAGIFSFCTKDQAALLYVLTPFALAAALSAEHAPRGAASAARAYLAAFVDRRMLLAAIASILTFVIAYQGVIGAVAFDRHWTLMSSVDYEVYRHHPNTLAGYATFSRQSAVNLWFMMGGAAVLAGVLGLSAAVVSKPRRWWWFLPLVLVVPYQIGMMVRVGLAYDRHLLPVAVAIALFAGLGLDRFLEWPRMPRAGRALGVALVLGYSLARAASIDALMLADPRYATEAWIGKLDPGAKIVGLGRKANLPRGLDIVSRPFQAELVGYHRLQQGAFHDCWTLRALDADFLVAAPERLLAGPGFGYQPAASFPNPFAGRLNQTGEAVTNLDKIPRATTVWRRSEEPCVEKSELGRLLTELASGAGAWNTDSAQRVISAGNQGTALGSNHLRVLRATRDLRMRGIDPVGIVVENPDGYPRAFEIELASSAPEELYPIRVTVNSATGLSRHVLAEPGKTWISLPAVHPGRLELFVLSSEKEWLNSGRDPRLVGPKLTKAAGTTGKRRTWLREMTGLADGTLRIPPTALVDKLLADTGGRKWQDNLVIFALGPDRRLTTIAALAARNPLEIPRAVDLRLGMAAAGTKMPSILVLADDARERLDTPELPGAGARRIRLGTVPAGADRLFLLRPADGAGPAPKILEILWSPAEDCRALERRLARLESSGEVERRQFIRELRLGRFEGVTVYDSDVEGRKDLAVGISADRWTGAAQPAGLIVANRSQRTMIAEIDVVCPKPKAARGIAVTLEAGAAVHSVECSEPGRVRVPIGAVDADSDRLVLVRTDRLWNPGAGDDRMLGVQLPRVRWRRPQGD